MLAGAMPANGDEAAARGMSGGSRSPALVNTIHPIINNNNPGKSYGGSRRHHGDHRSARRNASIAKRPAHARRNMSASRSQANRHRRDSRTDQ